MPSKSDDEYSRIYDQIARDFFMILLDYQLSFKNKMYDTSSEKIFYSEWMKNKWLMPLVKDSIGIRDMRSVKGHISKMFDEGFLSRETRFEKGRHITSEYVHNVRPEDSAGFGINEIRDRAVERVLNNDYPRC